MNRREFLKYAGYSTALPLSALLASCNKIPGLSKHPNLLIIHTDQQRSDTLSSYGGTLIETPFIDSLAKEGAMLTNFFTNSPVCTPSRGCFLTGRYPHVHGAYENEIPINRSEITLAHILQKNGYETGYAGKWHLDGDPKPGWMKTERAMGFQNCHYMFNRGHQKYVHYQGQEYPRLYVRRKLPNAVYMTDWLTDAALDFIRKTNTKPFFFMLSIPDPHDPYMVREPYDTMYDPDNMPVPSTFDQENEPNWVRRNDKETLEQRKVEYRKIRSQYCGQVKCIDDNVGRILDCLRRTGQIENTIIIFTTDHGDFMGEHGLMGKNNLFECVCRIPFLIRWPKKIPKGLVVKDIISTVDVQQTVLGLIGIRPSRKEQGINASALLKGEKLDLRQESFLHHSSLNRAGIFTTKYQLGYVNNGENVLYDRKNDPEQKKNLFYDPAYKQVVVKLTERIIQHNIKVKAPAAQWLRKINYKEKIT